MAGERWDRFNTPEWYGKDYFVTHKGMKYRDGSGQVHGWSYENPSGEMEAADFVTRAWKKLFKPKNLLDVGCILPTCEVITEKGYRKIKQIKKGHKLKNDNQVLKKFKRIYEGKMIYIKPTFLEGILFTPEHPLLIAKRSQKRKAGRKLKRSFQIVGFKKAVDVVPSKDVYKSDYVVVPKIKGEKKTYLDFPDVNSNHGKNLGKQDLDEGWGGIIGWYLAEGCPDGNRTVAFILGEEPKYANEILNLAKKKGLSGSITKRRTGLRVRVFSASLLRWLITNCGKGAKNKHLPEDFLCWNKNLLYSLIKTFRKGDGHERSNRRGVYGACSTSKRLIKEIQLALLKVGYPSSYSFYSHSISEIEGRTIPSRGSYSLEWRERNHIGYDDEDNYYFKVTRTELVDYYGEVQNLSTVSETYEVPFVIHNCGRGTVVAYARKNRIEAYGFDFSDWALTEGLYRGCSPEWVKVHDAAQPWPYDDESFDLVTALDFFEHIYIEDLPFVESELRRVARRWCFLEIAVAGTGGLQGETQEGYVLHKGAPVPLELEANAVAGHVLVKPKKWWIKRFEENGWKYRHDMLHMFSKLVYPPMIRNWWLNAILVLEKA